MKGLATFATGGSSPIMKPTNSPKIEYSKPEAKLGTLLSAIAGDQLDIASRPRIRYLK